MTAPRYRVTINGFWCHTQTKDSLFDADGFKDEGFLLVGVKVLDSKGNVLQTFDSQSELMGDANHPNRIRVGTGGPNGGIRTGDRFPADPIHRNGALNTNRVPPYVIWEDELEPGHDIVMLTPSYWEWDAGQGFWEPWLDWQVKTDSQFGQRAKDIFGKIWPVALPFFDAISLGIQTVGSLAGIWSPWGKEGQRPVGLRRDPSDSKNALFNPITIALNSETADYLATNNLQGHGPGILELRYVDDPFLEGVYSIFVQVEKLADGSPPTVPTQDEWRWCNKCQGLFFGRGQAGSRCPVGGTHAAAEESGSGNYILAYDAPEQPNYQSHWRWCNNCQGLYWGLSVQSSSCPAGGTHVPPEVSGSGNYNLGYSLPPTPTRQSDWLWCNKCQGLFYGKGQQSSRCPAGDLHSAQPESGSGNYNLDHHPHIG